MYIQYVRKLQHTIGINSHCFELILLAEQTLECSAFQLHSCKKIKCKNNGRKIIRTIKVSSVQVQTIQKVSKIETNQIEGLTLAIIIVLEFPPSESCYI